MKIVFFSTRFGFSVGLVDLAGWCSEITDIIFQMISYLLLLCYLKMKRKTRKAGNEEAGVVQVVI